MPTDTYRDFQIEPAPQKVRCGGVAGYKARAFVSPLADADRAHRPVADHDRIFDDLDAALRASLALGREWIDAHPSSARDHGGRGGDGAADKPPFAHRAPAARAAVWLTPGVPSGTPGTPICGPGGATVETSALGR